MRNRNNALDDAKKLGDYIRRLRRSADLPLRSVATTAEVDFAWLSRLERGHYQSPDPWSLYRLARALHVEVADLYRAAGYADGRGLPGFAPYLRAKYDMPEEAIRQLEAHFQLLNEKYRAEKGVSHDERDDSAA